MVEVGEETSGQADVLDQLEYLKAHPIDLNTATVKDLEQIPWLTPPQAQAIVDYRRRKGVFTSVEELLLVEGIDPELWARITPLVRAKQKVRTHLLSGRWRVRVLGPNPHTIIRDRLSQKVYTRVDFSVKGKIGASLIWEKDAYEEQLDDLAVGSLSLESVGFMDRLIIGNYGLEFGQGLVLWSRWGLSKSSEVISPLKKRGRGAIPYTSVDEVCPFQGISAVASFGVVKCGFFWSRTRLDANLNPDGTVSSLYHSGLHRTDAELLKKDALGERLYGGHCSLYRGGSGVGVTFYRAHFGRRFNNLDYERNYFTFRGSSLSVYSLSGDFYLFNLNLFGEVARSAGSGQGLVMGVISNFGKLELATLIRSYDPDFYSLHGYGFADRNGRCQNEVGALVGFVYRPFRGTRLKLYFDQFRHPWRGYNRIMPTNGEDAFAQLEHRPIKGLKITLRGRAQKEEVPGEGNKVTPRRQSNLRTQLDWRPYPDLDISGRLEKMWVEYESLPKEEEGELLFVGFRIKPTKALSLWGRLIFFDTPSYDSRVYEYENDLPGVMSNVALFGRGRRWFLLVGYKVTDRLQVWTKYSCTSYMDYPSQEGWAESKNRRLSLQVDLNFR